MLILLVYYFINISYELTLKDPSISENCMEIKIELNLFSHFFVVPQKVL